MTPHVVRLSIAPVKSLGLVHPDAVTLTPAGVAGDRRFWLVDRSGRLVNGTRNGPMVRVRPEWDEATRRLALTFPDGARVEGVVELGEPVAAEMYGLPLPSHRVLGPWEGALAEHVGQPLHLLWADGGAADRSGRGGTVSLVSRASLERLRVEAGVDEPVDGRRFRMLFEIDGVGAHEEDEWLDAQVQIGKAVILLNGDVGRCAVTTHDPERGVRDLDTLGVLAGYRREGRDEELPFGVYGAVVVPGRVRVGDAVRPLRH
ncbi:MAG TPA: MOSC N-terminal beta barrel domain-containing protein [Gaiellaceae bacterium]|nr:MOSC N-terminal beta barrel domain-containing protein [Gaiellaceae bacterium]